jgi:hypothetical protein
MAFGYKNWAVDKARGCLLGKKIPIGYDCGWINRAKIFLRSLNFFTPGCLILSSIFFVIGQQK